MHTTATDEEVIPALREDLLVRPDPRTMLAVMVVTNVIAFTADFSGGAVWARVVVMVVPAALALFAGKWQVALAYAVVVGGAFAVDQAMLNGDYGGVGVIVASVAGLVARVVPGFFLIFLAAGLIRVSELMAALEAWHVPRQLTIPLAVILRFLPTVHVSSVEVARAMDARGLTLRRVGITSWLEYRLVPLIISTVRSGEELSQAALTRGLGRPGRHTRIAKIGFGWLDALLLLASAGAIALWVIVP
ncbi:MAG: energy-coupling factor transporter transmembrane protein EcfT [Propionibacteriaceae bacterium]|nr:energy-coupling factor transporter transmembrane protein EcfT [Propionibacteriaceae bacterium]